MRLLISYNIEAIILDTKPNKASVETLPVIYTSDANNTEYNVHQSNLSFRIHRKIYIKLGEIINGEKAMAEIILTVHRILKRVRPDKSDEFGNLWNDITKYHEIVSNVYQKRRRRRKKQFKFGRTIREEIANISQKSTTPSKVILPVHAPIAEQRSAAIYNETFYFISQSQQINSRVDYAFLRFKTNSWFRGRIIAVFVVFPFRNYFLFWLSFIFKLSIPSL